MSTALALAGRQSREISTTLSRVSHALSAIERLDILTDTLEAFSPNADDLAMMEKYAKPVLSVVFRKSRSASLESRVGTAIKSVWQAIIDLLTYLIDRMGEYASHLMRATEGVFRRAYNAQQGLRNYHGNIPADVFAAGTSKMINGGLRIFMHRLGRVQGTDFVFDDKCLKVLDSSIGLLDAYIAQDKALGKSFVNVMGKEDKLVAGWFEAEGTNLWKKRATIPVKIPGSSIIGGKALYITPDGKMSLRPELSHTNFTSQANFEKAVRIFSRPDNLINLCQYVMDGSLVVRKYNNEVNDRLSVARKAKKLVEQAATDKQVSSEKRQAASAFVKVMYRRSELVSLSLIRTLETAQKVAVSFLK